MYYVKNYYNFTTKSHNFVFQIIFQLLLLLAYCILLQDLTKTIMQHSVKKIVRSNICFNISFVWPKRFRNIKKLI